MKYCSHQKGVVFLFTIPAAAPPDSSSSWSWLVELYIFAKIARNWQNNLSDDGDKRIRQDWARDIQSKWTITWCLSIRNNPWAARLLIVSHSLDDWKLVSNGKREAESYSTVQIFCSSFPLHNSARGIKYQETRVITPSWCTLIEGKAQQVNILTIFSSPQTMSFSRSQAVIRNSIS